MDARRPEALNRAIPQGVNCLVNSLADAGSIGLVGLLWVWLAYGRRPTPFEQWRWGAFGILLGWFVAQNLFVCLLGTVTLLAAGMHLIQPAFLRPREERAEARATWAVREGIAAAKQTAGATARVLGWR